MIKIEKCVRKAGFAMDMKEEKRAIRAGIKAQKAALTPEFVED